MSLHDVLNFFEPYSDLPAHHENQLTRAFLVALRMSPAAHQAWLSLVDPDRKLYNLPRERRYDTQRWRIFDSPPEGDEPIDGISVLQAADAQAVAGPVQTTDRGQVLDGIVRYGDPIPELVIAIETKLDGPVNTRQAQELNVHGARVRFNRTVSVSWRDLLEAWTDLVDREIVAGAERAVLLDFLDFVDRNFPQLGPFTTLRRCAGLPFRVSRRLEAVLGQIADGPAGAPRPRLDLPAQAVKLAYLDYVEPSKHIRLRLWPADTLTQARAFYTRSGAPDALLALREQGWGVDANFHFGYMASGLVWTTTEAQLEEYIAYWRDQIGSTAAVPRERWEEFWAELVDRRFARNDEKPKFDQAFTNTGRESAAPRPGLHCSYLWPLSEAERLDDRSQLTGAVAEQLNAVLRALGEKPFPP